MIAELITICSYVLLVVGACWLLAHAMPVLQALRLRRGKDWDLQAHDVCARLEKQACLMRRIRAALDRPASINSTDPVAALRRETDRVVTSGPHHGLERWLGNSRINCDSPVTAVVAECIHAEATTPTHHLEAASSVLRPDWRRVHGRFTLVSVLAPVVGLLGTTSGSMSFITAYGDTVAAARSLPPMAGLSTALETTCWGILLTVGAVLALTLAARIRTRYEQHLASAATVVLNAYREWQKERHQLETRWMLMEHADNVHRLR